MLNHMSNLLGSLCVCVGRRTGLRRKDCAIYKNQVLSHYVQFDRLKRRVLQYEAHEAREDERRNEEHDAK